MTKTRWAIPALAMGSNSKKPESFWGEKKKKGAENL